MIHDDEEPAAVRHMRFGLLLIALQFLVPAVSYVVDPAAAVATIEKIDAALGGPSSWPESGQLWHMLAVGNVATLAFLCLLIRSDVQRFLPALPALVFLKAFSSLYSLAIAIAHRLPAFACVFVLDGATTIAMAWLALRAAHALARDRSAPLWARWLLIDPERIEAALARIEHAPTLWQVFRGCTRMWHRIVFRSDTLGTSAGAVRSTWRARLFAWRAVRVPFLFWERAITPLDPSGLRASLDQIVCHLLAAHHDGAQLLYDVELLRLHERGLERARAAAKAVVDGTHPRAAWLRDLCVFEGYHEGLVAALDDAIAQKPIAPALLDDADITFTGFLRWCRAQPASAADESVLDGNARQVRSTSRATMSR